MERSTFFTTVEVVKHRQLPKLLSPSRELSLTSDFLWYTLMGAFNIVVRLQGAGTPCNNRVLIGFIERKQLLFPIN